MKEILIELDNRKSRVQVGGSIKSIGELTDPGNTFIITDSNLNRFYADSFEGYRVIEIGTGEKIKTLDTVEEISAQLIEMGADRSSFILAIGGGIVCDIAGFVASIFMRGVNFGFISTSVLSQVDASVGGKNGVNLRGLKNMVGVFNQPEFVICDHDMLGTLPKIEFTNGISEVIKSACLSSSNFFEYLEDNLHGINSRENSVVHEIIYRSVEFKAEIVMEDERETGIRKILNLGHTIGHGLEKIIEVPHGFAIAAGMGAVADISVNMGLLPSEQSARIKSLINDTGLDSDINNLIGEEDLERLINAMASDKKKSGDSISFILLEGIGKPIIKKIEISQLRQLLSKLLKGES